MSLVKLAIKGALVVGAAKLMSEYNSRKTKQPNVGAGRDSYDHPHFETAYPR